VGLFVTGVQLDRGLELVLGLLELVVLQIHHGQVDPQGGVFRVLIDQILVDQDGALVAAQLEVDQTEQVEDLGIARLELQRLLQLLLSRFQVADLQQLGSLVEMGEKVPVEIVVRLGHFDSWDFLARFL
jgi:hypothetical protein